MGEVFEGKDLSEAMFWGVDLQGSYFRDTNLSNSRFFHTFWNDVSVDGVINRLVVNGVDVTDYVNTHDRWYPLRTQLEPATADELRSVWSTLQSHWSDLLNRVAQHEPEVALQSVNGEWSLRDTLRHLLFAMDKWFFVPILDPILDSERVSTLDKQSYTSIGLPNTESQDLDWPGIDRHADPSFDDVLRIHSERYELFTQFIKTLRFDDLPDSVDVGENGSVPAVMCFYVVLEEEFEHLRYALRDLDLNAT